MLGVVGLVIGGIWAAASTVSTNMRRQRAVKQIMQVQDIATRLFNVGFTHQISAMTNVSAAVRSGGNFESDLFYGSALLKHPMPAAGSIGLLMVEIPAYDIDTPGIYNILLYDMSYNDCEWLTQTMDANYYRESYRTRADCQMDPSDYDNGDGYIQRCPMVMSHVYYPQECKTTTTNSLRFTFKLPQ